MIIIRKIPFPNYKANAFTLLDLNGDYNIYINSRTSLDAQIRGYEHELQHIKNNDFDNLSNINILEAIRHK